MLIAIDPDTQRHACAMGELVNGNPVCKRVWTIQRAGKKRGMMHPDYFEGVLDLIALAKFYDAPIVCEAAYLGKNANTFRELICATQDIKTRCDEHGARTWPHVLLSMWASALGIHTSLGSDEIKRRYMAFARNWARSANQYIPESEHECAAMGILWWGLTTGGKKK